MGASTREMPVATTGRELRAALDRVLTGVVTGFPGQAASLAIHKVNRRALRELVTDLRADGVVVSEHEQHTADDGFVYVVMIASFSRSVCSVSLFSERRAVTILPK